MTYAELNPKALDVGSTETAPQTGLGTPFAGQHAGPDTARDFGVAHSGYLAD